MSDDGVGRACIWRGPSALDGAPLIVLARGFRRWQKGRRKKISANRKTGDMISTNIFRADMSPYEMMVQKLDGSTCGSCKMRSQGPSGRVQDRACFPHLGMLQNQWEGWKRGTYPDESIEGLRQILRGQMIRFGSFGDPAMLPKEVWDMFSTLSAGHTAYTHQWTWADLRFRELAMASVDTPEEKREARSMGYRTFRTRLPSEPLADDEIACPASAEAGHKSHCEDCRLCDGSRGPKDARKNIAIIRHGYAPATVAYDRLRARLRVVS